MNPRTEANLNRMASDVHLVTWPIRWVVDFIKFVVIFTLSVLSPFDTGVPRPTSLVGPVNIQTADSTH
jgi:hypothetical protein